MVETEGISGNGVLSFPLMKRMVCAWSRQPRPELERIHDAAMTPGSGRRSGCQVSAGRSSAASCCVVFVAFHLVDIGAEAMCMHRATPETRGMASRPPVLDSRGSRDSMERTPNRRSAGNGQTRVLSGGAGFVLSGFVAVVAFRVWSLGSCSVGRCRPSTLNEVFRASLNRITLLSPVFCFRSTRLSISDQPDVVHLWNMLS